MKMKLKTNLPWKVQALEEEPVITTNQDNQFTDSEDIPLYYVSDYLYHGIRFQKYLEKLESIFQCKKILAGKYLKDYSYYSDNCNKGEYVSVLKWLGDNELEHETFILENISLVISPLCDATETKYIDYNTWCDLQEIRVKNNLKQLYSYLRGECMCRDYIPFEMVKAIGVPYQYLKMQGKIGYAEQLIVDISNLMEQYDVCLPIVDTSLYNRIIVEANKHSRR